MDQEYLLLGGRNIGDRYYNPENYIGNVVNDRDVFVWCSDKDTESIMDQVSDYMELLWNSPDSFPKIKLPVSADYQFLFDTAIQFEKSNPKYYVKNLNEYKDLCVFAAKISLIYNPIHAGCKEPWVAYQISELSLAAKDSVILQTPYCTGNRKLFEIMKQVSNSAEAVLLTNSMASSPNFPAFSNYQSQRKKFVDTGINIYEYQNTDSIHGKSLIIDDRLSIVGSFNMDDRSYYIDTESMLVIDSTEFSEKLKSAMTTYIDQSLNVGIDNQYIASDMVKEVSVSYTKKVKMKIFSVFSRLFHNLI